MKPKAILFLLALATGLSAVRIPAQPPAPPGKAKIVQDAGLIPS